MSPRRALRYVTIAPVAALLLVGLQVAAPASACACGAPAPRPGTDVIVDKEHAILSWDGGQERIELLLDMLTDAEDVGLVFPTPAPATVSAGERQTFVDIETAIQPRRVDIDDWWQIDVGLAGGGSDAGAPPVVLDQVQLGPVEATTLEASDTTGLSEWLVANDYAIRDEVAALLDEYVQKGWYFVALKLTSEVPLDGGLDPIVFRFDSDELVYPMALSKAATDIQRVRLYVFQDHRARIAGLDDPAADLPYGSPVWAGPTPDALAGMGAYLSVVDLTFDTPATQVPGDLVAVDNGDDEPIVPTYEVHRSLTLLGIPAGVVVILGAAVLLVGLFALGAFIARSVRRRA
ncbi:MAG TPA: DUF2330 domain-containing protein [Pseudolysinimonas sp.]